MVILAAGILLLIAAPCARGDQEIRLRSGRLVRGTVERRSASQLFVMTPSGEVVLAKEDVESILQASALPGAEKHPKPAATPAPAAPRAESVPDTSGVDTSLRKEVDRLRLFIRESSRGRKEEAAAALTKLGRPAVPYLLEIYESCATEERPWLTWVLRDIGDPRALGSMLSKLGQAEGDLKVTILQSLGRFDDPRVFEAVAPFAAAGNPQLRRRAYEILASRNDPRATPILLTGLSDEDDWVRESSEDALRSVIGAGTNLFAPLASLLSRVDDSAAEPIVRLLAATRDPGAIEPICETLGREEPKVRRAAVRALGRLDDRRASESLEQSLDDADAVVRREAIASLARLREKDAFLAIVERLADPVPEVRAAARRALVSLSDHDEGNDRTGWVRWWSLHGEF